MNKRDTILVVDDASVIRITIGRQLTANGYNVLTAENGLVGMEILEKQHTSLAIILLDVIMPKMDGIAFLKRVRIKEEYGPIQIMMLTSTSDRKIVIECLKLGAREFIIKPVSINIINFE